MSNTHIYALIDPTTNQCRYVGKSNNPKARLTSHLSEISSTHKIRWVNKLRRQGYTPNIEILETCNSSEWQDSERFWISYFKFIGANLTNNTHGGDGSKGCKWSEEQRKNLSNTRKLKPVWNKGISIPEEIRDKISKTLRDKPPRPLEIVMKTVIKNRGKKRTEEQRLKMSESQKGEKNHFYGKKMSKESNAKRSESIKRFYANNPDACKERSKRALDQWQKIREAAQ